MVESKMILLLLIFWTNQIDEVTNLVCSCVLIAVQPVQTDVSMTVFRIQKEYTSMKQSRILSRFFIPVQCNHQAQCPRKTDGKTGL